MATRLRSYTILTIIYLLIFVTSINSQISISASDILALKGTARDAYTVDDGTDTVAITPAGINQVWDYRDINTEMLTSALLEYLEPAGGYRSDLFPEANLRQRISATTDEGSLVFDSYMNVSSNILRTLGSAADVAGFSFIEFEDDDAGPLPMTYGTSWISVSNDTSDQFGFITITNDSTWNSVDAYGTLRLSMGDLECLRLRELSKTITESTFNGAPIGPPDTTIEVSYVWLSKNHLQTFVVDSLENNLGEVRMTLSGEATSVKETFGEIPNGYSLNQNYPNPFNPSTTIEYSIAEPSYVSLKVFNILGKEIASLVNDSQFAGNYRYKFDGSKHSSGTYIVQLRSGKFLETRKMLLMK